MEKCWCLHCYKLVEVEKKTKDDFLDLSMKCPFCGAGAGDLFPVKECKIKVPIGAKHGDYIGYPEMEV